MNWRKLKHGLGSVMLVVVFSLWPALLACIAMNVFDLWDVGIYGSVTDAYALRDAMKTAVGLWWLLAACLLIAYVVVNPIRSRN